MTRVLRTCVYCVGVNPGAAMGKRARDGASEQAPGHCRLPGAIGAKTVRSISNQLIRWVVIVINVDGAPSLVCDLSRRRVRLAYTTEKISWTEMPAFEAPHRPASIVFVARSHDSCTPYARVTSFSRWCGVLAAIAALAGVAARPAASVDRVVIVSVDGLRPDLLAPRSNAGDQGPHGTRQLHSGCAHDR